MVYTELGEKRLSKIVFGCADFGARLNAQGAFEMMDEYFERGGNVFDTARIYCEWLEGGANASEHILGEWIRSRGVREHVFISTKGGHPPIDDLHTSRLKKDELTADINASLRYLQTDCVDVYYLHRDDNGLPVSEIMPILDGFVKAGKTRYLGAANWTAERMIEANAFAIENGLTPFTFNQNMWSYATVNAGGETDDTLVIMDESELSSYKKSNVILMPYGSQAQGFYTKAATSGVENLTPRQKAKYLNERNLERLEKVKRISAETGLSPTAIGLAYLLYHKELTVHPVIGAHNKALLNDSLGALALPKEYLDQL